VSIQLSHWARLYSNQTNAEKALEPAVASLGVRYRTQHPLWALGVFPDFVLLDERVVIEVDDPSHNTAKKKAADRDRTAKLKKAKWTVVRCTNAEALSDPYGTVDKLMQAAGLPHRTRKPNGLRIDCDDSGGGQDRTGLRGASDEKQS
jgi:very-short-patch-repair endonuclease